MYVPLFPLSPSSSLLLASSFPFLAPSLFHPLFLPSLSLLLPILSSPSLFSLRDPLSGHHFLQSYDCCSARLEELRRYEEPGQEEVWLGHVGATPPQCHAGAGKGGFSCIVGHV